MDGIFYKIKKNANTYYKRKKKNNIIRSQNNPKAHPNHKKNPIIKNTEY